MQPVSRSLVLLGAFALFTLSVSNSSALDAVWPLPIPPAGTNPAVFPVERQDWLAHVQANFDNSKGKRVDLLFDGDSITDLWVFRAQELWASRYGALHPFDFGMSGDRTEQVLWRLGQGQVDGLHPKLVVLLIGTNNLARDTPDQIAEGIKAVVGQYLQRCPEAHLLLLGLFPRGALPTDPLRLKAAEVNKRIATFDDGKRITYLDIGSKFLSPDGTLSATVMHDFLHPTPKGYQIWADAIQPMVDQYVGKPSL